MSRWTQGDVDALMSDRGRAAQAATPKPSKYRNVKTTVDGITFDSKREALHYHELKMRERAGEIYGLERQKRYPLMTAHYNIQLDQIDVCPTVCEYVADFYYLDSSNHRPHIVDVKGGKETAMFALKRKWLFLQSGIEIEVIR